MRVFGIDPGSVVTGFGVVDHKRGRYHLVAYGCIRTKSSEPMGSRLQRIHQGLDRALREHQPDEVSIESIFRHRSSESALRLGQARGVALLAAADHGFEATSYNPMVVKRSVGAHGRADKDAVQSMVCMLLGIREKLPADASDALAIAMTHCHHMRSLAVAR